MGNKNNQRNEEFFKMVQDIRKDQTRRISIHPEKKYLALMLDQIEISKLPQQLKKMINQTIKQKILEQELIESITCINALKNNQFDISSFKSQSSIRQKPESQFVKIIFAPLRFMNIMAKYKNVHQSNEEHQKSVKNQQELTIQENNSTNLTQRRKNSHYTSAQTSKLHQQEIKNKLRNLNLVLKKQLNRISNPFGKLNKTFAQYIFNNLEQILPNPKLGHEQVYEKCISKLIINWCNYLQCSCLTPYKKWAMGYTGLEQLKYKKWIHNIIVQQIWAVNNGYLFSMLSIVINSRKVPLKININQIQYNYAILTPSLFGIAKKLQIQGHFFDSIYEMSQVESKCRPEQIVSQLQVVKKRICTDIDNYHRLIQIREIYQIDSDNILGIVTYILCKIANKIDQIYVHLIFLRIIYGDGVYYNMGISSYIFSTILAAFQFLQSQDFKSLLSKKAYEAVRSIQEEKGGQNKYDTKCTNSNKDEIDDKQNHNHIQLDQIMVSSLILAKDMNNSSHI